MGLTPYEEINELVETLIKVKEITLEGTDLEFFSKTQLESLVEVSKQIISVSEIMISTIDEDTKLMQTTHSEKQEFKKEYLKNNHYCSKTGCGYETGVTTQLEQDADSKLNSDGGYNRKDETLCPKCKSDSLIFIIA